MSKGKDWNIVKYHKDFAMVSWKDLNAFEQDILATMLVAIRNRKDDVVSLPVNKLEEVSGKRIRKYLLKDQMKSMRKKFTSILADFETEDYEGTLVLFPTIWVTNDLDVINIRINPDYKYLFNDFDFKYLKWNLLEHIALPTAYSKSLYRYLSAFLDTGFWHIELNQFREMMNISKNYDTHRLMDKVVNPSVEIIRNTLPDKFGDLNVIKIKGSNGKTVEALRFEFMPMNCCELESGDDDWDTCQSDDTWDESLADAPF